MGSLGPKTTNLHISSKKTAGQRSNLLREFVGHKRALMTNARCLTEGVDVPAIDCVMFADPKQSRVDIVQAAGRALRQCEGKEHGYIIVPLVVPEKMGFEKFAETTAFKQVAQTITALSTQDERIADEFRAIEKGRVSTGRIVEIEGDIPAGMKMKLGDFAEAVSTRVWESLGRANWRRFEDARDFVRRLGLGSVAEWHTYCKSGKKPADIPTKPNRSYENAGWTTWGDWLGTGRIADWLREHRPFKKAGAFVRSLGLKSVAEWKVYCQSGKKPEDIPANPHQTYANDGWAGWGEWLGTGRVSNQLRQFRSFKKARAFVSRLGLKSGTEWRAYCKSGKKPTDIPANPDQTYAEDGWSSWGDWLGTGTVAPNLFQYRPFKKARVFVRGLGLKSESEWRAYCKSGKKPTDIPANPGNTYAEAGWLGLGDWLGTGRRRDTGWRPFNNARAFVHHLGLKNYTEWNGYCRSGKKPADIPAAPDQRYAEAGWAGWGDWLGTGRLATHLRQYRSFEEARTFVRDLGLKSNKEWRDYCKSGKKPSDIPNVPHKVYANGWVGLSDWLGTGRLATHLRQYRSLEEARTFVRSLGLNSQAEWTTYSRSGKKPADIPADPYKVYANDGWEGFGDWLGTGTIASYLREYRPFKKARPFVRGLGLKSLAEWRAYCRSGKKPKDIPSAPDRIYAEVGWAGMADWLGYVRSGHCSEARSMKGTGEAPAPADASP
jgi:3-mercaptopyruvate sulfurtransferase SseA